MYSCTITAAVSSICLVNIPVDAHICCPLCRFTMQHSHQSGALMRKPSVPAVLVFAAIVLLATPTPSNALTAISDWTTGFATFYGGAPDGMVPPRPHCHCHHDFLLLRCMAWSESQRSHGPHFERLPIPCLESM